jgi:hypothetical protein
MANRWPAKRDRSADARKFRDGELHVRSRNDARNRHDLPAMRRTGSPERAERLEVHCLAVVFFIIAAIHSVLAVAERVAWPVLVASACVAGHVLDRRRQLRVSDDRLLLP